MATYTAEQIADRVTISAHGLGGADLVDVTPTSMTLALGNGQRFKLTVEEIGQDHGQLRRL